MRKFHYSIAFIMVFALATQDRALAKPKIAVKKQHTLLGYKKDVMLQLMDRFIETELDRQWKKSPVYIIEISKSGKVVSVKLLKGTGTQIGDRQLISMLSTTQFAPTPSWYKGKTVSLKLDYPCSMEH